MRCRIRSQRWTRAPQETNDARSDRVVFVSHCLLNQNTATPAVLHQSLVLATDDDAWSLAFELRPVGVDGTRVVTRLRSEPNWMNVARARPT